MVSQNYAIFPHLTVEDNIRYGLKARKIHEAEQKKRVQSVLSLVHLQGLENRLSNQLSGGQLQRVAIARVLVVEPDILLMDEPLSNLDAKLRVEMRGEIKTLQQNMRITTIYVTHDQEEALSISDRIAVMDQGVVRQVGKPWEIYSQPQDAFVASFIGATKLLPVEIAEVREGRSIGKQREVLFGLPSRNQLKPGMKSQLAIRPECFQIWQEGQYARPDIWPLKGNVSRVEYLGNKIKYEILLAPEIKVLVLNDFSDPSAIKKVDEQVKIFYELARTLVFPESKK